MSALGVGQECGIWCMIETPLGVLRYAPFHARVHRVYADSRMGAAHMTLGRPARKWVA